MENNNTYFSSFFKSIKSLSIGLKTTMREFFTPKVTEQYPENRKELKMFDRFRGTLVIQAKPSRQRTARRKKYLPSMSTTSVRACSASSASTPAHTAPSPSTSSSNMPCSTARNSSSPSTTRAAMWKRRKN